MLLQRNSQDKFIQNCRRDVTNQSHAHVASYSDWPYLRTYNKSYEEHKQIPSELRCPRRNLKDIPVRVWWRLFRIPESRIRILFIQPPFSLGLIVHSIEGDYPLQKHMQLGVRRGVLRHFKQRSEYIYERDKFRSGPALLMQAE